MTEPTFPSFAGQSVTSVTNNDIQNLAGLARPRTQSVTDQSFQNYSGLVRQSNPGVTNHEIQNHAGLARQRASYATNSQTHKHSGLAKQRTPSVTNKDTHKLAGLARHTITSVTKSVKNLTVLFSYRSLRKTEKTFIKSAPTKASGSTDISMTIVHTAFIIPQITDKIILHTLERIFLSKQSRYYRWVYMQALYCQYCTWPIKS